jgi:leader peptidase (prepilin peptidase)/N-methyltransferase
MIVYYIIFFVLGLVVGFLLNVCIYRIPERKPIITPASQCRQCGTTLKLIDLVPVLSYILLRGRCRYCGLRFSARYPLVELLTGIVSVLLFQRYGLTVEFVSSAFLMSVLIAVFFIDIDHRIIPDSLVLTSLAGGVLLIVYNFFVPVSFYGDRHWWNPLAGILSGAGVLFLVALIGMAIYKNDDAMGMGDVKIFVPIGIFLGWRLSLLALLLSMIAGGLVGLFIIISGRGDRKSTIAFGPFIVIGAFISFMWGWDILKWYILTAMH